MKAKQLPTPRVDSVSSKDWPTGDKELMPSDCGRDLEREVEYFRADYERLRAQAEADATERDALRAKLERAQKDTELLDWLEVNPRTSFNVYVSCPSSMTIRNAIDGARLITPHEEPK